MWLLAGLSVRFSGSLMCFICVGRCSRPNTDRQGRRWLWKKYLWRMRKKGWEHAAPPYIHSPFIKICILIKKAFLLSFPSQLWGRSRSYSCWNMRMWWTSLRSAEQKVKTDSLFNRSFCGAVTKKMPSCFYTQMPH